LPDLLVLQHTPAAGPSAFVEVLDSRTTIASWRLVEVESPDDIPDDVSDLAGIIVMGGTMSATSPKELPWMPAELEMLRSAVKQDVPVLGVCLGAQMLAAAHGGEVERRGTPQIAYIPLSRTPDADGDPVMGGWQDGAAPLFLHEDEVTRLPEGAVAMLKGGQGTAGWRLGSAWAVQFHPEVHADQLEDWLSLEALTPLLETAGVDGEALLEEARTRDRGIVPIGRALVGRFIDAAVRPHVEGS
jgi:GMP synthase (glutamine-hydrolysing)